MTVYHFPELTDESALYWLAMDTWKPYDAAWLLCGIDPHGMERSYGAFATELCTQMCGDHPVSKAAFQIVELLKSSEKAGRIAFPAAPGEVIAWAKAKQLRLPRQFLDAQFGGTEQTAAAAGGAGGRARAKGGKQGGDRLTRAMIAAYDVLREKHRTQPTCRALFDWLKDNDETGAVEDSRDDVLTFRRGDGGLKDVEFEAFEDRFSRLPQRKTPH
jgi:hypothetical protein